MTEDLSCEPAFGGLAMTIALTLQGLSLYFIADMGIGFGNGEGIKSKNSD